jgi:hypothetical protein
MKWYLSIVIVLDRFVVTEVVVVVVAVGAIAVVGLSNRGVRRSIFFVDVE